MDGSQKKAKSILFGVGFSFSVLGMAAIHGFEMH